MTKKQELKNLLSKRVEIFNMLDTRFSRYELKRNTWLLAENTGFSIIEVSCIYDTVETCK